jgi:UDP-N-acetylglucosamine/UDP-N-acetylgalactosamine diphosphorylase
MTLPSFSYAHALDILSSISQEHLLHYWESLSPKEKAALLQQVQALDFPTFRLQQRLLTESHAPAAPFSPLMPPDSIGNRRDEELGKQLMDEGAVGCLILAGGQGTRLDFDGPKGMCPITPVMQKSLFQLFAEKTAAASQQASKKLPLALMTSPANHRETETFFASHSRFGLEPGQLSLFSQQTLPVLDQEGNLFLERPGKIAMSPDGNGKVFAHFYQSGLWQKWQQQGVRLVNLVLIDNPLADPFDAELFGYHERNKNSITLKCCLKKEPQEKVGVLVQRQGKIEVVEYSELPEKARFAADPSGQLLYKYANLSLFCFSMEQIRELAVCSTTLPLHKSLKNALQNEKKTMAWKFETFIFDLLPHATKTGVLLYPRERCFAPLKNSTGDNSIETVRHALQARDQELFASIAPEAESIPPFELSQAFHYPTASLLSQWHTFHGRATGYIE